MYHFYLPLAKTADAGRLFDKIHNAIHQDNNEVKTDRFDDSKITQVILCLLNGNEMYYDHIRILMIPIRIKNRCTIAYTDNHQECIFMIPDAVNDPENINVNEIEDLSYTVIKQKFGEAMETARRMRGIANPVQETVLETTDDEKYPETTAPPPTPISNTYTPITVVDNTLFNGYVSD